MHPLASAGGGGVGGGGGGGGGRGEEEGGGRGVDDDGGGGGESARPRPTPPPDGDGASATGGGGGGSASASTSSAAEVGRGGGAGGDGSGGASTASMTTTPLLQQPSRTRDPQQQHRRHLHQSAAAVQRRPPPRDHRQHQPQQDPFRHHHRGGGAPRADAHQSALRKLTSSSTPAAATAASAPSPSADPSPSPSLRALLLPPPSSSSAAVAAGPSAPSPPQPTSSACTGAEAAAPFRSVGGGAGGGRPSSSSSSSSLSPHNHQPRPPPPYAPPGGRDGGGGGGGSGALAAAPPPHPAAASIGGAYGRLDSFGGTESSGASFSSSSAIRSNRRMSWRATAAEEQEETTTTTTTDGDGGDESQRSSTNAPNKNKGWTTVETTGDLARHAAPCRRSLHAAAVLGDALYIFGGYDGQGRVNDFYSFHFPTRQWNVVPVAFDSGRAPSPRDRHAAVVHNSTFYVFGGFDGTARTSDLHGFDTTTMRWGEVRPVLTAEGNNHNTLPSNPPSPRHSHSAVVYRDSMYVFGGYDGSYRSDFHAFHFPSSKWSVVPATGRSPRARYRAAAVVRKDDLVIFGGHDGTRHLADCHVYDLINNVWSTLVAEGVPPLPRDSHVAVVHRDSVYVFGGSTGSAMNDLHELRLPPSSAAAFRSGGSSGVGGGEGERQGGRGTGLIQAMEADVIAAPDYATAPGGALDDGTRPQWRVVSAPPGGRAVHRFCHVGAVHGDALYVFGGYDGQERLNDFIKYDFAVDDLTCDVPPSTILSDLRSFLDDDDALSLSDVTFLVEDQPVRAHRVVLLRCPYFRAMLLGDMMESRQGTVKLEMVRHPVFLAVLEYLYTDDVSIPLDVAMELFVAADLFGIPRLQAMCERRLLESIAVENAATIFHAADLHSAKSLRDKALRYILSHFEDVSKTAAFEEMARGNVELVLEVLSRR